MRSRRSALLSVVLLFAALVPPIPAQGAVVRGQLFRQAPNGARSPAGGIAVTVFAPNMGRSSPSYTDGNGMYYLGVPAGNYTLEVWTSRDPRVPPLVFQIAVHEPSTDIAPIRIP